MPFSRVLHTTAVGAVVISSLVLIAGCSRGEDAPAATPDDGSPSVQSGSKLGDLTKFRRIADDVSATVGKGELAVATAKIKDLEVAWDSAEAGLKPRAVDDWHALDKAIDRALSALRASSPSQADANAAMGELLKTFDALGAKG